MYSLCKYVKCSVQAYRSWTDVQESSRLYFTLCTLAQLAVFGVQRFLVVGCNLLQHCQCKIRLPTQVYMFSIRRSRLLNTLVCIVYVSM